MSEETNNPVYKLTTDKLQPVLVNVLIWSIFENWYFTRWYSDAFKTQLDL